ncbi:uncharacterized protein Z520_07792 [Fonsecaea multimorphosa CBS 102226]|uniref:FAD/NAD(P)-binding domain-containing protein n=1 Tax=Fonsecaea multimorphosa CBS 102226 TaxID=1442371 RepID=A0A0D2IHK9_9EURO|nr:uncharacterized protein Z520_07792 [Fonsecaea multimorphosa CBS 102226]KIX96526.1 hypothetical protein Z520_07792 [Fonsecaea multimorphosa CBS 102226]OAL28032.1 hypothetical protein AYO22_03059 [Fonsecaea multimorphosa]
MFAKFVFCLRLLGFTLSLSFQRLCIYLSTKIHRLRYHSVPDPRNVVIIGGSFAGYFLAKRLSESLPTGYRVILIERHSHFHFTWNFPRATVLAGQESNAIIPYPRGHGPRTSPEGAYVFKQGAVAAIETGKVILQDGSEIRYEYLAIATGSRSRYPAKLDADADADTKAKCLRFFREEQKRIVAGQDIVVVGGGAAGVEVAGDIKSKYPRKNVTLVHSRERLLNSFDEELHGIARKALEELGVQLCLGERVVWGLDGQDCREVRLRSGKVIQCDVVIQCTGQTPNSTLLKSFSPSSVSATSGAILADKNLRVRNTPPTANIFALGDVIELPGHAGPKMGRAATMQGFLVAENIVRLIRAEQKQKQKEKTEMNKTPSSPALNLKEYTPSMIDSSIELTLGLENIPSLPPYTFLVASLHISTFLTRLRLAAGTQGKSVMFISDGRQNMSFAKDMSDEALHAAQAWRMLDARPFVDPGDSAAGSSSNSAAAAGKT